MGNNNETWFGSFVTVMILMWLFSGYFSSTHIVMSYAANCYNPPIVNGYCNGKSGPSVKTYFSVNKDKQEVVSHTNQSGDTPIKYKNCTIADEKNWTCEYLDNQTNTPDLGFSDGNFTTLGKKVAELDNELGIHYVSSFRWWLLEFGLGGGSTQIVDTTVQQPVSSYSPPVVTQEKELRVIGADFLVYPFDCSNQASTLADCQNAKKASSGRIAFKVDTLHAEIVHWYLLDTEANNSDTTYTPNYFKNKDCTIIDSNNWSCQSAIYSSGVSGVTKGKYFDTSMPNQVFGSFSDWASFSKK